MGAQQSASGSNDTVRHRLQVDRASTEEESAASHTSRIDQTSQGTRLLLRHAPGPVVGQTTNGAVQPVCWQQQCDQLSNSDWSSGSSGSSSSSSPEHSPRHYVNVGWANMATLAVRENLSNQSREAVSHHGRAKAELASNGVKRTESAADDASGSANLGSTGEKSSVPDVDSRLANSASIVAEENCGIVATDGAAGAPMVHAAGTAHPAESLLHSANTHEDGSHTISL